MYTLKELKELGCKLLDFGPGTVQKYRILKDIIGVDRNTKEFNESRRDFFDSGQYIELEGARENNGMWGQYHTENTRVKRKFKTTEVAMKRCQSLGLEKEDQIIKELLESVVGIYNGKVPWPDRTEKTNAWMDIGFRWPLVGGIAALDRFNPVLDEPWEKVADLVKGSFKSGRFRQQDHDETFLKLAVNELSNAQKKRLSTIQFIATGYWVSMVGSTHKKLPYDIEMAYIDWLANKPDGIYYKSRKSYKSMPDISDRDFMGYMRVHSLLSSYDAWKKMYSKIVLGSLRAAAGEDGLWYPGRGAKSLDNLRNYELHQLADNWRRPEAAKIDFSIFILDFIRTAISS